MKEKQYQIPERMYVSLLRLVYCDLNQSEQAKEWQVVRECIHAKTEAYIKRELYTKYKTDPDPAERERARQEYLDSVGMRSDFRW